MSTSFRKTIEKLNEQADGIRNIDGTAAVYGNCAGCGDEHNVRVLSTYGGSCLRCHEAYCAAAFAPRPDRPETTTQREMRQRLRNAPLGIRRTGDEAA